MDLGKEKYIFKHILKMLQIHFYNKNLCILDHLGQIIVIYYIGKYQVIKEIKDFLVAEKAV